MTISTISEKPFTLNAIYKDGEISTETFATASEALLNAREEVKWGSTVHVTVTDERSGVDLFDADGDFVFGEK